MRSKTVALALLSCLFFSSSLHAVEQKPDAIAEKMAFKLVRGVTNIVTCIVEVPKQTVVTAQNHGPIGYIVGPVKGIGMMFYRGFIGLTETVFFSVPQPGYYEPMMNPEFVWQDWSSGKESIDQGQQKNADKGKTPEGQ